MLAYAAMASRVPNAWRRRLLTLLALGLGMLVRVHYAWVTPPDVRGHDQGAHLEYVEYVYRYGAMPDWRGGIEFYQPPLFYFLAAGVVRASGAARSLPEALFVLQSLSVVLSGLALVAALWIGHLLFPDEGDGWRRGLYALLFALFPATVIDVSGRINNDVLLHALSIVYIGCLLRWWTRKTPRDLAVVGLVLGVGLLTKASFLVLGAAATLLLLSLGGASWRRKLTLLAALWGIALALSGWCYVLRFGAQGQRRLVANADFPAVRAFNDAHMRVPNDPRSWLTFSPPALIEQPYNNPWNDSSRRDHFLEFLFRSALFGEHDFGPALRPLAVSIVVLALLAVPVVGAGLLASLRNRPDVGWPLLLITGLSLAGLVAHRMELPYSSNQDFRFLSWTAVPLCFWAAEGAALSWWGRLAALVSVAFAAAQLAFFMSMRP